MNEPVSRRQALKRFAVLLGVAAAALPEARRADAAALPHLTSSNPEAMALGYVDDAAKVDKAKYPTYMKGDRCDNCLHLMGKAGDTWRPCNLYPGYAVNAHGWCSGYAKST